MLLFRYVALLFCLSLMHSEQSYAEALRVAVAANFIKPAKVLASEFEAQTGHKVSLSFSSTGKLYAQIKKGARYDLLLAADSLRPRLLVEEGLTAQGFISTYAFGRLVFLTPKSSHASRLLLEKSSSVFESGEWLSRYQNDTLAIANPKLAPYGAAAAAVLEVVSSHSLNDFTLVKGESVGQAFQMVYAGAARAGFVSLSQVIEREALDWLLIPKESHPPIEQQMVLLKQAEANEVARAFYHFVSSPEAQKIIRQFGYEI